MGTSPPRCPSSPPGPWCPRDEGWGAPSTLAILAVPPHHLFSFVPGTQVSSHIQVLARKKVREYQVGIKVRWVPGRASSPRWASSVVPRPFCTLQASASAGSLQPTVPLSGSLSSLSSVLCFLSLSLQVSSHLQVLARRKSQEIQSKLKVWAPATWPSSAQDRAEELRG